MIVFQRAADRWFFFSSRRRHTRLQGDWSSDVCSSDLREQREGFRSLRSQLASPNCERSDLKPSRCSRTNSSGCSHAAKCPPLGSLLKWIRSEERRVGKEGRSRGWPYP